MAILWILCRWRPGRPRRAKVGALIGFGANLFGFNLVSYFSKGIDSLLLGWRWGATPLGLYGNARRLMQLPVTQLNAPMTQVAIPALSRVVDQPERYRLAYVRFVEKIQLVALPGVAFLKRILIDRAAPRVHSTRVSSGPGASREYHPGRC